MEGEYKGLLPPISVWLSSVGNPRMGLGGVQEAPLAVRDAAPHKDSWGGGQIQEGKAMSSALPYHLPFSPIPLLPPWAKPPPGARGGHAKIHAGLSEDMVEPRKGPLV